MTAATDANFKPLRGCRADPRALALSAPSSRFPASFSAHEESTERSSAYAAYLAARSMRESRSSAAMSPRKPTEATGSANAFFWPLPEPLPRRSPVATLKASTANGSLPASAARFSASLSNHCLASIFLRTGGLPIRSGGRSLYMLPVGPLPPPMSSASNNPPIATSFRASSASAASSLSSPSMPTPLESCRSCPDGR